MTDHNSPKHIYKQTDEVERCVCIYSPHNKANKAVKVYSTHINYLRKMCIQLRQSWEIVDGDKTGSYLSDKNRVTIVTLFVHRRI